MNADTATTWMIAFTAVASAALVIQVILVAVMAVNAVKMRRQVSGLIARVEPLIAKIEPLTETSRQILEDVRRYAGEMSAKANQVLDLGRKQLVRVDEVLAEAATRSRAQMDRIEMVMDDTVNRFQETTSLLQNGIVRPLRQINALTAGVKAALAFLVNGRRTTVEQATHDEEMFI